MKPVLFQLGNTARACLFVRFVLCTESYVHSGGKASVQSAVHTPYTFIRFSHVADAGNQVWLLSRPTVQQVGPIHTWPHACACNTRSKKLSPRYGFNHNTILGTRINPCYLSGVCRPTPHAHVYPLYATRLLKGGMLPRWKTTHSCPPH